MSQTDQGRSVGLRGLVDPSERAAMAQVAGALNSGPVANSYHRMDFGDGMVINGIFDIDKYLHHYHLPDDLTGATVLDVGSATGYFAMTCAARGAEVTAIDVFGHPPTVGLINRPVRYLQRDVYSLDEAFGTFDLVICGSLLLHLPDPLGAIRKLRQACHGRAIISTACGEDSATSPLRRCVFVGEQVPGTEYWTYWAINGPALVRMCEVAGFSTVEHVEHFTLVPEPGSMADPGAGRGVDHVVLSATV